MGKGKLQPHRGLGGISTPRTGSSRQITTVATVRRCASGWQMHPMTKRSMEQPTPHVLVATEHGSGGNMPRTGGASRNSTSRIAPPLAQCVSLTLHLTLVAPAAKPPMRESYIFVRRPQGPCTPMWPLSSIQSVSFSVRERGKTAQPSRNNSPSCCTRERSPPFPVSLVLGRGKKQIENIKRRWESNRGARQLQLWDICTLSTLVPHHLNPRQGKLLRRMANPTQPGVEVISKGFKRDDNDTVLCNDRVEIKVPRNTNLVGTNRDLCHLAPWSHWRSQTLKSCCPYLAGWSTLGIFIRT